MSAMEIYAVNARGSVVYYDEIRNAHRGAMLAWMVIGERHHVPASLMNMKPVWDLAKTIRLTSAEWFVMMMTFDRAVVALEDFDHAIRFCREFGEGHWPAVADLLEKMRAEGLKGVCFNQTSVGESLWTATGKNGKPRKYNVNKDREHFFVRLSDRSVAAAEVSP